jgi:hypothetical protein
MGLAMLVSCGGGRRAGPRSAAMVVLSGAGGAGKPRYGEIHVCFDRDEKKGEQIAYETWPVTGLPGPLGRELPLPSHFEACANLVPRDKFVEEVPCGPDPEKHIRVIRKYIEAGYDRITIHQIGPNQEPFMDFYAREVIPRIR